MLSSIIRYFIWFFVLLTGCTAAIAEDLNAVLDPPRYGVITTSNSTGHVGLQYFFRPEQPQNNQVVYPDGMGGTIGYTVMQAFGPYSSKAAACADPNLPPELHQAIGCPTETPQTQQPLDNGSQNPGYAQPPDYATPNPGTDTSTPVDNGTANPGTDTSTPVDNGTANPGTDTSTSTDNGNPSTDTSASTTETPTDDSGATKKNLVDNKTKDVLGWVFVGGVLLLAWAMSNDGPKQIAQARNSDSNTSGPADALDPGNSGSNELGSDANQNNPFRDRLSKAEWKASWKSDSLDDAARILRNLSDPNPQKQDRLKAAAAIEAIKERIETMPPMEVSWFDRIVGAPLLTEGLGWRNAVRIANKNKFGAGENIDIGATTWHLRLAQCGEHAEVLGSLLQKAGVDNVEIMLAQMKGNKESNHAFVVMGRQPGSNIDDPRTWGKNAVIADSFGPGHIVDDMKEAWTSGLYFCDGKRVISMTHTPGTPPQYIKQVK